MHTGKHKKPTSALAAMTGWQTNKFHPENNGTSCTASFCSTQGRSLLLGPKDVVFTTGYSCA